MNSSQYEGEKDPKLKGVKQHQSLGTALIRGPAPRVL
jgi:hypothetical protein